MMKEQAMKLLRQAYREILEGSNDDDQMLIEDGLVNLSDAIDMLERCVK
jgi:hypothetical protein